jgi:hypothetical protein
MLLIVKTQTFSDLVCWIICLHYNQLTVWNSRVGCRCSKRQPHKTIKIFIAVGMNITYEQGSRARLVNTDENSLRSGLAWASDGGDTVVPEKGRLSEAGQSSSSSELAGASGGEARRPAVLLPRRTGLMSAGDRWWCRLRCCTSGLAVVFSWCKRSCDWWWRAGGPYFYTFVAMRLADQWVLELQWWALIG